MPGPYPDFPQSFRLIPDDKRVKRPQLFEPALQHCPNAFRHGEPQFRDASQLPAWHAARRAATDDLLQRVAESAFGKHLVLRGSTLLRTYLGPAAREPGDMDWVVQPETITPASLLGQQILQSIRALVEDAQTVPGTEIRWGRFAEDDIWLYSRSPGKRITATWLAPELPAGDVQMDFVFGEELWAPPIDLTLTLFHGAKINVFAASPAQSLAWKIMWLQEDNYAQGKDLYDAVLLAENFQLPQEMRDKLTLICRPYGRIPFEEWSNHWHIDWENFQLEYPTVPGTAEDWVLRLGRALSPELRH